jgi:antitoxin ChpS
MSDAKIQRWGNSMALRIPATMLRAWGIEEGQAVALSVEGSALVVRPTQKRYRLGELLAQCDFSKPMSAEEREWIEAPAAGLEQP